MKIRKNKRRLNQRVKVLQTLQKKHNTRVARQSMQQNIKYIIITFAKNVVCLYAFPSVINSKKLWIDFDSIFRVCQQHGRKVKRLDSIGDPVHRLLCLTPDDFTRQ